MEADLRKDKVAKSAAAPALSLATTWATFHYEFFGDEVPQLPLTVDILVALGSMFKCGDYRSFPNYVSAVKVAHIEHRDPS